LKIEPQNNHDPLGGLLSFSAPSIIYLEQSDENPYNIERWLPQLPIPEPDLYDDDPYLFDFSVDIFDFHLERESDEVPKEFKELYIRSCKEQLPPSVCDKLGTRISIRYLLKCGFGMNHFKLLADHNPLIVASILILMKRTSFPDFNLYLGFLLESPMNLAKNEIMVQISPILRQEDMYSYIAMCIDSCTNEKPVNQARSVRLLCLLVIALLKTKTLLLDISTFEQLKMFSVQFAQIKDAANLYQILEQMKIK
jgi:hypothetical protein